MEIIITLLIIIAAVYIFYKSGKNKSQGQCDCSGCSSHCSKYKEVSIKK